ncbi:MAG: GNAT family N-acetyltransferase [Crocinitomicaceae bacterium]|nr:GNAT family N-acetyltransferase [Crocinitomicaceae bacterium]
MIAETDRLILRELQQDDAEYFFELNNDPNVLKYTGDVAFKSVKEARDFLKNYSHYAKNGYGRWVVIRKSDHEFLGWCGLRKNEEGYVDIGFRIFQAYWGNGYATEAAQKSIDLGFEKFGLREIIGRTADDNHGSFRVLEKIGMTFFKNGECHGIENASYFKIEKPFTQRKFKILN